MYKVSFTFTEYIIYVKEISYALPVQRKMKYKKEQ